MMGQSVLALLVATSAPAALVSTQQPPSAVSGTSANLTGIARCHVFIAEAARRFNMPEKWIMAVMAAESAGRTMLDGRPITSRAGAMGLMQLMPQTWAAMRIRLGLGADPQDPHDNIMAGTYYLRLMYDRFGYPGLFGAYNAGPARYAAWLAGKGELPSEPRTYLANVAGDGDGVVRSMPAKPANGIFFALHHAVESTDAADTGSGIFVALESASGEQATQTSQDPPVGRASEIATK